MPNTLIIDGNSIGHANHNATKLTVGDMQTQAIFGVVKSVRALAESYPGWNQLVLWDGKSAWRKEIYPEYKENRKAKDEKQAAHKEAYKAQSPFIRKALQLLGVRQMLCTSAEADDMAGLISKRLNAAGNQIVLVTGDQDWIQLIKPGIVWFDPIRDNKVNLSNLFEFTGFKTVEAFLDGKALTGDSSDCIKGVGGIGEKGAPEFLAQFQSVQRFFDMCDAGTFVPKKKAHQNLASPEGRVVFERNRKLMNLLDVPNPPSEDINVIAPCFDKEKFRLLCEKLAFASILRDFDGFVAPFEQLNSQYAAKVA